MRSYSVSYSVSSPSSSSSSQDESVPKCAGDVLTVTIRTDKYPEETRWVLRRVNLYTGRKVTVVEQKYASEDASTLFVRNVCLKPGNSYRWKLYDYWGDGLCTALGPCGYYSVELNGEEIVSNGYFEKEVLKEIGPVDCAIDEPGYQQVWDPEFPDEIVSATCKGVRAEIKRNGSDAAQVCGYPLADGSGTIGDRCKVVCAAEGQGPCA